MRVMLIVGIVAFLSGCVTAHPTVGPNGQQAFSIRCGAANPGGCYEKAGVVCPAGYNIVTANRPQYLGTFSTGNAYAYVNPSGAYAGAYSSSIPIITPNTILVECK